MRYPLPLLLSALLLAGCEDGAPDPERKKVVAANPVSDQLRTMTPLYRNLGLRRAIVDSNQRCKRVDDGAYQEQYKTMAMWVARCSDSGDWQIFIAPNSDVQVRQCRHAEQIGLPACKALPAKA